MSRLTEVPKPEQRHVSLYLDERLVERIDRVARRDYRGNRSNAISVALEEAFPEVESEAVAVVR